MITRLLQIDLTKRININEIMEHEWIKEKYNNFM